MYSPEPNPAFLEAWAQVERLTKLAQSSTFHVGDLFLSPGGHHFRVTHVSADGCATMVKGGPGWKRSVFMRWNSPKLDRWVLLESGAKREATR
jgi:hypothetical protein